MIDQMSSIHHRHFLEANYNIRNSFRCTAKTPPWSWTSILRNLKFSSWPVWLVITMTLANSGKQYIEDIKSFWKKIISIIWSLRKWHCAHHSSFFDLTLNTQAGDIRAWRRFFKQKPPKSAASRFVPFLLKSWNCSRKYFLALRFQGFFCAFFRSSCDNALGFIMLLF